MKKRFKAREIDSSLRRKGFKKIETKHHTKYVLYVNDKKTSIHTYISHGVNELSPKLLKKMAKQLKLKYDQFVDLIDCPLTGENYVKLLLRKNIIKI